MTDALAKAEFTALSKESQRFPLSDVIKANFGPQGITPADLDRIKVPSSGAVTWEIETMKGTDSSKTIDGIVVAARDTRVRYIKSFDESDGGPPDCFSPDAIEGFGDPGGPCASCEFAQWGSGKGNSQACSLRKMMLVLREKATLPVIISAPPGSYRNITKYMGRLTAEGGLPSYAVVTSLALEKAKNPENVPYSKIVPSYVRELTDDEVTRVMEYRDNILPAFNTAAPEQEETKDSPY